MIAPQTEIAPPGAKGVTDACFSAALKLHQYLVANHWRRERLAGPDPGVRFNFRVGRFVKSYLPGIHWNDSYCYMQAQGYWILANWLLFALTAEYPYAHLALRCSESVMAHQRADGAWDYPNREWKGRVATAEGTWASLGLLRSYLETADARFRKSIEGWNRFLLNSIGFQSRGSELAVNYFAGRNRSSVPNNSAMVLRHIAELANVMRDGSWLNYGSGLLAFLSRVQQPSGEIPYSRSCGEEAQAREHFQCFQYHAFMCLDLCRYYELTRDTRSLGVLDGIAKFLPAGVTPDGQVMYQCGANLRHVTYHATAVAAAYLQLEKLGLIRESGVPTRLVTSVLGRQLVDGSFPHSQGDYGLLHDTRSYPRYLAMILYHLILLSSRTIQTA